MRAGFALAALIVAATLCPVQAGQAVDADLLKDRAAAGLVQVGGKDLWTLNPDLRLPPASLTKIMTALVVLERYRPAEVVTVSPAAAKATGTRLRLRAGERYAAGDLLKAMLMASANDACSALAEHAGGSATAFVAAMNRRAAAMGLANSHFANPCGFDAPDHYSSARDLATLAHAAMKIPEFAGIVALAGDRIASVDGKRAHVLRNRNALVGTYAPAIGIKTGYTGKGGRCLIALAEKDGRRVLVVLLNAKDRWWDTIGLIEHAFDAAR
jgi:D-alanyl-D-alanine carboxypeptidase (penicillin-binding protein 5/6)